MSMVTKAHMRSAAVLAALLLLSGVARAEGTAPAVVLTRDTGAGLLITDAKGMTLYTYDRDADTPGSSACVFTAPRAAPAARPAAAVDAETIGAAAPVTRTGCAKTWPPLMAATDAQPSGDWSVITRDDGSKQWAFRGKPLYGYEKDTYAGAVLGDGVQQVWHVAFQPISMPRPMTMVKTPTLGRVLADARGMTLYFYDRDKAGASSCTGDCLQNWVPVSAPWVGHATGDWSPVSRDDGTRQWAYKGKPLYAYRNDVVSGDSNGDGLEGAWHTAMLEPPPAMPAWVTVQSSDMGDVLANADGMTIYAFAGNLEKAKLTVCNDECIRTKWRPVRAEAGAKAVNNWSVVTGYDGQPQWAYRGEPLFTHTRDFKPGDIVGDKFGKGASGGGIYTSGGWWVTVLRWCMCSRAAFQ